MKCGVPGAKTWAGSPHKGLPSGLGCAYAKPGPKEPCGRLPGERDVLIHIPKGWSDGCVRNGPEGSQGPWFPGLQGLCCRIQQRRVEAWISRVLPEGVRRRWVQETTRGEGGA